MADVLNTMTDRTNSYLLENAKPELQRLIEQSRFFGNLTEHVFYLAGIENGMRVLDPGCGPGDVTFLAAQMVGPDGFVTEVDRSPEAIAFAQERTRSARLTNVRFVVGDADQYVPGEPVDALVGRFVLM